MLRLTLTRRPPPPPGCWGAQLDRLLAYVSLAAVALLLLGLALLTFVPQQSRGSNVPYTGCAITSRCRDSRTSTER